MAGRGYPMIGASFVKCLADPAFSLELQVPKEFVKKYGETLQPTIELRLESGPRISWNVDTELVGNRCFLTEGWGDFAEEAGLKHLETVVFTFIGISAFDVSVYDVNGCKKHPSDAAAENVSVVEISDSNDDDEEEEITGPTVPENWTFSREVKNINYSDRRMRIPSSFVFATGIGKAKNILLLDGRGREWPVKITDKGGRALTMSAGFMAFMKANDVKVGSTISFKFIRASNNTVEARITPRSSSSSQLMCATI